MSLHVNFTSKPGAIAVRVARHDEDGYVLEIGGAFSVEQISIFATKDQLAMMLAEGLEKLAAAELAPLDPDVLTMETGD